MNARNERSRGRGRSARWRARRGVVLVFFALFLWVIMGIAALVIDQGAARLTQRQLHAAADGVALEQMRDRDQARDELGLDDYLRDRRRRIRANRMSVWHFHPALVTGVGGEAGDVRGGGAYIDLQAGFGNMDASARVMDAGFGVPRLSPNYGFDGENATPLNLRWGDVVSGSFLGSSQWGSSQGTELPPGIVGVDGNPFHVEDDKYVRTDFEPADPADAPFADSMVVRLRRTRSLTAETGSTDPFGLPSQEYQEGVSTAGNTLPYFFGRGTTMIGIDEDTPEGYSPRRDGQIIRATSIGSSRPAVRANPPLGEHDSDPLIKEGFNIGVAPFCVTELVWRWDDDNFGTIWKSDDGGRELYVYVRPSETGELVVKSDSDFVLAVVLRRPELTRVGDRVSALLPGPGVWEEEKNWLVGEGYAPVIGRRFVFGTGFTYRVIGFVRVRSELDTSTVDETTGLPLRRMKLTKLANDHHANPSAPWIAPRNASAVFDGDQVDREELEGGGGPGSGGWSWEEVLGRMNQLPRAIHAPVIVR